MSQSPDRFLVYVVAYRAERHLCGVFERIPPELFNNEQVFFLVSDDASGDEGPERLREWLIERRIANVAVVSQRVNQGYGGNQKLGFRVAIEQGFDCVILLHGDGQYAPELLPRFMETWSRTRADVILGSRMHSWESARRGGMPLYKRLGNRILTTFQNLLTGWRLTEYHTGYRAYSTDFLRAAPFELNANEFHFDTDILLQAAHIGATVEEIPIPTHYGDEVCHVPGLKYAWDVIAATTRFRLHQMGMLCSLKLRNLTVGRYQDKTETLYTSHRLALTIIEREQAETVLDIGCGPGHVARQCVRQGRQVTGVDRVDPGTLEDFRQIDLETDEFPLNLADYDVTLLLDVIEHLSDPERFLIDLRHRNMPADPDSASPLCLISTPNVAFVGIRLNLLLGRFNYAERGILDITHKRLFTRGSLLRMLEDCGYQVEACRAVGVPFETVLPGWFGRALGGVASLLAKLFPRLFAFQFLVECRPKASVRQTLLAAIPVYRPEALKPFLRDAG